MQALQIHAGPRARAHLAQHGLQSPHVAVVPAAAGGPKGLILNHLDRFLFGDWFAARRTPLHLVGASIGAWRMAIACRPSPRAALADFADGYIGERYELGGTRVPSAPEMTRRFEAMLQRWLGGHEGEVLSHAQFRLHVVTSRGRHLMRREHRIGTPLGYLAAFASNAVRRRALGAWLQRVVFSDARDALPFALNDLATQRVGLDARNLLPSILASGSIPFWVQAVHDIAGAPSGAYWDGGITDYHLHWPYHGIAADAAAPLVLYPHFQAQVVPGWLDKSLRHRHRSTHFLDNVLLLCPRPEWIAGLPGGKLPDRGDVKHYQGDFAARTRAWRGATDAGVQLADEFAEWLARGTPLDAVRPL